MTEEEAKTKWCPFARVLAPLRDAGTKEIVGAAAGNRVGLSDGIAITGSTDRANPESARCIGSNCMAWRDHDEPEEVATDRKCEVCKGSGVVVVGSGETAGGEECNACVGGYQTEAVATGYCGLAGKP